MMTSSFLLEDLPSPKPPPTGLHCRCSVTLEPGCRLRLSFPHFQSEQERCQCPWVTPFRLKKFGNTSLPLLPRLRKLSFLKFVERNHNLQSHTPSPR